MSEPCSDPMSDPEGYGLWCEMAACRTCDGLGTLDGTEDGTEHTCLACDGTGIAPSYRDVGAEC